MNNDMNETMAQIYDDAVSVPNKRQNLQQSIDNLKKNIKYAQKNLDNSNIISTLMSSISPEQANESKKILVFLKKDLAIKQAEFDQLVSPMV